MKVSRIKYDPRQSLEEIARNSGVTVDAVRRYIKTRNIDRKYDDELLRYQDVKRCMRKNPEASYNGIAKILGISAGTARKYGEMRQPPMKPIGKVSVVRPTMSSLFVSVSDSQYEILRAILASYLKWSTTYDCDLTTGKGGFYSGDILLPQYLFDINPQGAGVKHLDEAINLPNEIFQSVVIDLPSNIISPNRRRSKKNTYTSFESVEDMKQNYDRMIRLAWRLLDDGGILVFKTADFSLEDEPVWASDMSISLAVEAGFKLVDKYIYIDRKAMNVVPSSLRRIKIPAHAYFLVFKKVRTE